MMTDDQRKRLREELRDSYRNPMRYDEPLILSGFVQAAGPISAAIEFDFLPDPRAAVEPVPRPIVIPAPFDPAAAFVGLLMANPGLAADVIGFLRLGLDAVPWMGYDARESRIVDALARLDKLQGDQ